MTTELVSSTEPREPKVCDQCGAAMLFDTKSECFYCPTTGCKTNGMPWEEMALRLRNEKARQRAARKDVCR